VVLRQAQDAAQQRRSLQDKPRPRAFRPPAPVVVGEAGRRAVCPEIADGYDPSRHQISAKVTAGKRYRRAIGERAQAVKQEAVKPKPNPLEYTDINTGERNSVLTPGGMGQLVGHRLKFDPAAPEQGVFFMAPDGSSSTRVDVVGKNKPGELMFMVPDSLAAGDYVLMIRAGFGEDDVRMGTLEATLTVAA